MTWQCKVLAALSPPKHVSQQVNAIGMFSARRALASQHYHTFDRKMMNIMCIMYVVWILVAGI
jgi:hypothetical protein